MKIAMFQAYSEVAGEKAHRAEVEPRQIRNVAVD